MMLAIAFAVYTGAIIVVGLVTGRRTTSQSEDYFLGGRTLGPWLTALSAGASGSSAWVTMGLVGFAFVEGVAALWLIPGVVVGIAFNWFVLAKRMRGRAVELGAVTVPDLLALRYGERHGEKWPVVRLLTIAVILSAMFLYVAAQMAAAGQLFAYAFPGMSYLSGVVIGVAIVLAYTIVGGFRAACWTDLVQSLLMLVALVGVPIIVALTLREDASLTYMLQVSPELRRALPEPGAGAGAVIGFLFGSGALGLNFGYPGQPHILVRYMAMRDDKVVRMGAVIELAWTVLIFLGAIATGLLTRAAAFNGVDWAAGMADGQEELALIVAAGGVLPEALAAVVLAAIFCAMASTADSQLIVAASAVSSDGYDRIIRHGRPGLGPWLNRATVLALGAGAGVLVIDRDVTIYAYVLEYGWAILGAAIGPQVILGLLWRGSTRAGCIAGLIVGGVGAVAWKLLATGATFGTFLGDINVPKLLGPPLDGVYNLTAAFVASAAAHVVVSLLMRCVSPPGGE